MDLRKKVMSGVVWSAGGKFGTQIATWGSTILVMRILVPEDYGLVSMAAVFVSFCMLLNELGLGTAIIQAKEITDRLLRQTFGLVLLINLGLFLILLAATPAIAAFYEEPRLNTIIPVLALQFPILAFFVVPNALITRNMQFKAESIISMSMALSNALVTLGMAWYGYGVWSLVTGAVIGFTVRAIAANIAEPFLRRPVFSFAGIGKLARFGGYVSLGRILWFAYARSDALIIGKLLGKTTLGFYSVAMHIASLPMEKVGSILQQVGLPAYSRLQDEPHLASRYLLKASRAISLIAFPVFFGISVVAPGLVLLLLGDKWEAAIMPVRLLSLVVPLRTLSISIGPTVEGMGYPQISTRVLGIACLIMPTAFLVGTNWGLLGVSVAWIAGYTLWFFIMLQQSLPVTQTSMGQFFRAIGPPLLVSSIMYLAAEGTRWLMTSLGTEDWMILIGLSVTGAVVYAGGMWFGYRDRCLELWALRKSS